MSLQTAGNIVLVGAGKMGLALAQGWLNAGLPPSNLLLVDPRPSEYTTAFAAKHGVTLASSIGSQPFDIVVLAVKPQIITGVLAEIKSALAPETLVISIAAGISIAALIEGLGTNRVVRTMPNTPAQIGKGITGAVPAVGVTEADTARADTLLKAAGPVIWFDSEDKIDALTAVSGSGPAYVFHFVEALAAAAMAEGLSEHDAMALARQTIIGAAGLLEADQAPAATLRENVTSPKGTTAAALAILMADDGLGPLVQRAVHAARLRSEELGKGL